jgi:type I site-specific restriction endonuclease
MSTSDEQLAADLEAAAERVTDLESQVETTGEERLARLADAYRGATRLLERYEERATDYDDFAGYVEFQEAFVDFVEDLPEDLPEREAFEAADDCFQKSRLTEADFEAAREALAPAREQANLLERYREARSRLGELKHEAERRYEELDAEAAELEHTLALGATDLDLPVEELRDPITEYDAAVREAFDRFRREAPAREVLALVDEAASRPLLDFQAPPTRLAEYVAEADVGEEPIPKLLEYADYSASKLDHYVAEPHELTRHVATNRTYLGRLDGEPLTVGWPPPPASTLRFRTEAFQRVVTRFAPDETVAKLRTVRKLAHDGERYGDLREAAHALAELGETGRKRLESGALAEDLAATRATRDRLGAAIDAVA